MINCLIDSGNSRVKFAIHQNNQWRYLSAVDFEHPQFIEQCVQILHGQPFDKIYLANVSKGKRAEQLERFLVEVSIPINRINTQSQLGKLKIAYTKPEQLGVDRFLTLLAASVEPLPCIIISFGSALTLDVITAEGQHLGGLIAPSPEFQWRSMHNHFPGLFPAPGIVQDLAQNTADALTSGIELQTLALLEQTIASNNKTGNARVFLTGGGAKPWLDKLTGPCDYVPDMVFHGMHCYITVNSHE